MARLVALLALVAPVAVACGGGASPPACPGPSAGGAGLLAGTVVLGADGSVLSLQPSPGPGYSGSPGGLAVSPGTRVVVRSGTAPATSDPHVLMPVASPGSGYAFRAAALGCAELTGPGLSVSITVRAPVS